MLKNPYIGRTNFDYGCKRFGDLILNVLTQSLSTYGKVICLEFGKVIPTFLTIHQTTFPGRL